MTTGVLVTRLPGRLAPDAARVVAQLFVPGHVLPGGAEGRASGVVEHVLALDEAEVRALLAELHERFGGRHRDLTDTFRRHAGRVRNRLDPSTHLSEERWQLLGATFTQERSVEAAALCNPSMVASRDQSGVDAGSVRFVMSVRQIGEGHTSSIGFRTGIVSAGGTIEHDAVPATTATGEVLPADLHAAAFADLDAEAAAWALHGLGERFTIAELEGRLVELDRQRDTRTNASATVRAMRAIAARTYRVEFDDVTAISERVLLPASAAESNGVEDARFVRFVDDGGAVTYYATYTAFDGVAISQQLLATDDFVSFTSSPLQGLAATGKGMALFPRRIGGRFVALTRHDGASNGLARSDDIRRWTSTSPLSTPTQPWESVQAGNCGPPIETEEGWLVLTHGVGPMRTYAIGAWLLDLDDPAKVLRRLQEPLLEARPDERDGYVPNVVYSCGALAHAGTLVVPYGIGDAAIGFATVDVAALLASMR